MKFATCVEPVSSMASVVIMLTGEVAIRSLRLIREPVTTTYSNSGTSSTAASSAAKADWVYKGKMAATAKADTPYLKREEKFFMVFLRIGFSNREAPEKNVMM